MLPFCRLHRCVEVATSDISPCLQFSGLPLLPPPASAAAPVVAAATAAAPVFTDVNCRPLSNYTKLIALALSVAHCLLIFPIALETACNMQRAAFQRSALQHLIAAISTWCPNWLRSPGVLIYFAFAYKKKRHAGKSKNSSLPHSRRLSPSPCWP